MKREGETSLPQSSQQNANKNITYNKHNFIGYKHCNHSKKEKIKERKYGKRKENGNDQYESFAIGERESQKNGRRGKPNNE